MVVGGVAQLASIKMATNGKNNFFNMFAISMYSRGRQIKNHAIITLRMPSGSS
jgi:hypothetical protein